MADFEKMYFVLFNAMTDAQTYIMKGNYELAKSAMRDAQIETEEMFISSSEQNEGNGGSFKADC